MQDGVGLYNVVTGETYGLYSWSGASYTVSSASGDPFTRQIAEQLDSTGQDSGTSSLERQANGDYTRKTKPSPSSSYRCFTKGTQILTASGEHPVEDLCVGDEVITKDFGAQRIRWIGRKNLTGIGSKNQSGQPITIKAQAFGPNVPSRDTKLSPNHAILNNHWRAPLYFGDVEVLTTSKSLLNADYAFRTRVASVSYFHILLDQHNLVQANRLWSESLFLGSECMKMLSPPSRSEIFDLFPQLGDEIYGYGKTERQQVKAIDGALLI